MDWQTIIAFIIMIPVIVLPALLIWYLNSSRAAVAARNAWRSLPFHRNVSEDTE